MTQIKSAFTRANYLAAAGALVFAALLSAFYSIHASALALTDRSLMVSSTNPSDDFEAPDGSTYTGLDPGDPRNGAQVSHTYRFTTAQTNSDIEAITIQVCDSPFGWAPGETCNVPDDFTAAAWDNGEVDVTYDVGGTPATEQWDVAVVGTNLLVVTNDATTFAWNSDVTVEIDFEADATNFFVNPSSDYFTTTSLTATQPPTYFAHVATHDTDAPDTTNNTTLEASFVDNGTVTNNITQSINIYTRVQETLNFSVEGDESGSDGATESVGACDPLTGGRSIVMGDANSALAFDTAYDAYSYFRLATNSANGTVVFYSGDTLKSGPSLSITPTSTTGDQSDTGTEQFGLAFDDEHDDHAFGNLAAVEDYENGAGDIQAPGVEEATFAFDADSVTDPVAIASSTGIVQCDTGAVRYIANISPDTEAGIYTTKINYIASPSY